MKIPEFENQEELKRFLELETEYVQALHILPLQLMLPSTTIAFASYHQASQPLQWLKFLKLPELIAPQPNGIKIDDDFWSTNVEMFQLTFSPLITEGWEQLNFYGWLNSLDFDEFDVRYVSWVVFNPIHLHGDRELLIPDIPTNCATRGSL